MGKDIFNYAKDGMDWLANKLKKEEKPDSGTVESVVNTTEAEGVDTEEQGAAPLDYASFLEKMRPAIFNVVEKTVTRRTLWVDRVLDIFIGDEEYFAMADANGFAQSLDEYIENRTGYRFQSVNLKPDVPEPGMEVKKVNEFASLVIYRPRVVTVQQKQPTKGVLAMMSTLSISILQEDKVVLEPLQDNVWNIGWGESAMFNGRPRINHIAFRYRKPEDGNSKAFPVSRAHAHIKYDCGTYFLYVDERGTRQAGKRTKIERGQQVFELNDTAVGRALKSGDIIRLNDEYLVFTMV